MTMNKTVIHFILIYTVLWGSILALLHPAAAGASPAPPPVIETGFAAWAKSGPDLALNAWQKGGLLEGDNKVAGQSRYFRQLDRTLGNYRSYEPIDAKSVGQNSQVVYVSINFEHGAVYARFHLYRAEKNWVVQNMDFSTKPETIMPWLAFEGTSPP